MNMQYVFTGFTHQSGFRVFAFDSLGDNRVRTGFTVMVDLALIRKYGIRVQELPLLCRAVLERRTEEEPQRTFTYTEADMSLRATASALEVSARKRKMPRKPSTEDATASENGTRV
jgi:hypothetical protein